MLKPASSGFKFSYFLLSDIAAISPETAITTLLINPRNSLSVYLWFIYTLFIIMSIVHLTKDKFLFLLFIISVGANFLPLTNILCIKDVSHYLPFFILGRVLVNMQWTVSTWFLIAVIPLYLISIIIFKEVLISGLLGCIMLILLSLRFFNGQYFLEYLGKYSASIYFMHPFFIWILLALSQGFTNQYFKFAGIALFSMLMPVIIDRYIMKNKLLRTYLLGK